MRKIFQHFTSRKLLLVCLAIGVMFAVLALPSDALSDASNHRTTTVQLYSAAASNAQKNNYLWATLFLYAYIQRDAPSYVNNTNGHRDYVNGKLNEYIKGIYFRQDQLQGNIDKVNANLRSCGCYPCLSCEKTGTISTTAFFLISQRPSEPLLPPPDAAIVCVDYDYAGQCVVLPEGVYNTAEAIGLPNDIISSVMVGSGVTLTLCLHGGLTGPCITFTGNDNNISDNKIDNTYNWNDNATSAKVTRR